MYAVSIDVLDRLGDVVRVAKIGDRPAARFNSAAIVADDEAAGRQPVIQVSQPVMSGFVHVPVEPYERQAFDGGVA